MKRLRYIALFLLFVGVAARMLLSLSATPRVSVSARGFETNSTGQTYAVVAITNASRRTFTVWMQAQTNGPIGWTPVEEGYHGDPNCGDLGPDSQGEFRFPLSPPTHSWRVVIVCYPPILLRLKGFARVEQEIYDRIFQRVAEYRFISPEMPPNKLFQPIPINGIATPVSINASDAAWLSFNR